MPNYSLQFHRLVRDEVSDAYRYYQSQKPKLGDTFLEALDDIFNQIIDNPNLFPRDFEGVQKALLRKFPFSIYFEIIEEQIFVYSVFHQSRNPESWQERVQ